MTVQMMLAIAQAAARDEERLLSERKQVLESLEAKRRIEQRTARLKAAASKTFDQAIKTATAYAGNNILFADPDDTTKSLLLRITEVTQYNRAESQTPVLRMMARIYETATDKEFSQGAEIVGIGPLLRERPLSSLEAMAMDSDGAPVDLPDLSQLGLAQRPMMNPPAVRGLSA